MTFPFRRKTEFYSSKTKKQILEEIKKMISDEKFTKADAESVTGDFVIRTTNRLWLFDIVFCGNVYEFEGKTLVIAFAKMRLFAEVLLLLGIGMAGTSLLYIFSEDRLFSLRFMAGALLLCGLFWAISYLQFKPALSKFRSRFSQ